MEDNIRVSGAEKAGARQVTLRLPLDDVQINALRGPHGKFEVTSNKPGTLQINYRVNTHDNIKIIEQIASCREENGSWYLYVDVKDAMTPREDSIETNTKGLLLNTFLVSFGFAEQALKLAKDNLNASEIQLHFARANQTGTEEEKKAALAQARDEFDKDSLIYDLLKPLEALNSIVRIRLPPKRAN